MFISFAPSEEPSKILSSELTNKMNKRRQEVLAADTEAVFEIIKGNRNHRKFLLRDLEKVETEQKLDYLL